ncbi:MAG TPA: class I SAM-dependent methyltransferase [Candidatus Manganitrophaceae bacterium]
MEVEDYLERAESEMKVDNRIEALKILEAGYEAFKDPHLLRRLEEVRSSIRHLEGRDRYKLFYREIEENKITPGFFSVMNRKIRSWSGQRARKLIRTFPAHIRYQKVEEDVRKKGYRSVLDVGCYEGQFAVTLGARNPEIRVIGVDLLESNIEKANELNRFRNVEFRQGFAEDIGKMFPPDSIDFIMLFEILEHVIDVEEILASALMILRGGGMIAVTTPEGFFEYDQHVRHFSDDLISKLFGWRKGFQWKKLYPGPGDKGFGQEGCYWNYITFSK